MEPDKKLETRFTEYQNLAKENKNIDIATLMMNDLSRQSQNKVSSKMKKWAYFISISLPPFGFLFAIKFYLDDKDDAKSVGNVCILLTVISIAVFWLLAKMMFAGSGASLNQIQQIKPSDIQQLMQ